MDKGPSWNWEAGRPSLSPLAPPSPPLPSPDCFPGQLRLGKGRRQIGGPGGRPQPLRKSEAFLRFKGLGGGHGAERGGAEC